MFRFRSFSSLRLPRAAVRSSEGVGTPRLPSTRFNSTSSKPNRFRLSYIWYALAVATGASAGYTVRLFAAPLPLPEPGTREDGLAIDALTKDIDGLEIVKSMRARGYHLHSDTPLNEAGKGKGGWVELDIKKHVAEVAEDTDQATRTATQQSLAGAQGLGVQRAFWNSETREMVAVVWIGGALSGWPGLAHGGAIATIFEDVMSRMVAGPNVSIDSIPEPSSMSVTYARPTQTLNFYILRASFSKPDLPQEAPPPEPVPPKWWLPWWKDLTKKTASTGAQPTAEIIGTLESVEGELCVRAKGTFPVSTG